MNRWYRFLGYLGVALFIFGLVGGLVIGFGVGNLVQVLMLLQIFGGIGLVIAWFILVGSRSKESAGEIMRGRRTRFSANVTIYAAVFLGLDRNPQD